MTSDTPVPDAPVHVSFRIGLPGSNRHPQCIAQVIVGGVDLGDKDAELR